MAAVTLNCLRAASADTPGLSGAFPPEPAACESEPRYSKQGKRTTILNSPFLFPNDRLKEEHGQCYRSRMFVLLPQQNTPQNWEFCLINFLQRTCSREKSS